MSFTPAGLICFQRRESPAYAVFGDDAGDHEVLEVLGAARLGAAAAHLESAKRLAADDRPGDAAVDVEIAADHFCRTRSMCFGLRE